MWKDIIIYNPMYVTFFWAIVLLSSHRKNNPAKHFLGIFMVTAFFLYLAHAVFFKRHFEIYFVFDIIYIFSSLAVYPLYFLYIKLLSVESKLKFKNLLIFIPSLVLGFSSLVIYLLMLPEERLSYIHHFLLHEESTHPVTLLVNLQKWVFYATRIIFAGQVFFYMITGGKLVVRYNKRIANFYSNLESRTIIWVNMLLFSFVAGSVMSIIFNIIGKAAFLNSVFLLLIPSVIFSVLLFVIGLQGYMQNHTVTDLEFDEQQINFSEVKKYNSAILKEHLLDLFTNEAIYKHPDLKITQISSILQTNRTYISNMINSEFSCTFSDFVNRYRISEAKRMLTEDASKNYSLDYVSEKSGFGSMGSFMRVFKEVEGISPGRYRDNFRLQNKQIE